MSPVGGAVIRVAATGVAIVFAFAGGVYAEIALALMGFAIGFTIGGDRRAL